MKRKERHMTSMLEALLMLAREGWAAEQAGPVDVHALLDREAAAARVFEPVYRGERESDSTPGQ